MAVLLQLCISFFTVGLFSFGGGYAILSFLQQEVERRGWMSAERFVDLIAISQSTPGPIAINMATYVGYEVAGVPGSLLASLAVMLPGMTLMLLLAIFFFHFYEKPRTQALFKGLRPAVIGMIAAAAWQITEVAVLNLEVYRQCGCLFRLIDWKAMGITLVVCYLIARFKLHPIPLILGSALVGVLIF